MSTDPISIQDLALKQLGSIGATLATEAACQLAQKEGWLYDLRDDLTSFSDILKPHLQAALREGMADFREAMSVNMPEVATETFKASLFVAGLKAVKEWRAGWEKRK